MNLRQIIQNAIKHHQATAINPDLAPDKPPHRWFRSWLVVHQGPNRAQRRGHG